MNDRIKWLIGVAFILALLFGRPIQGQGVATRIDSLSVDDAVVGEWYEVWGDTTSVEHAWCGYGTITRGHAVIRAQAVLGLTDLGNGSQRAKGCPMTVDGYPTIAVIHTHPGPRHVLHSFADSVAVRGILYRVKHYGSAYECDPSDRDRSTQSSVPIPVMVVVCADDTYAWLDIHGARHELPPRVVGDLADDSEWRAPHDGFLVEADTVESP